MKRINKDRPQTPQERLARNAIRRRLPNDKDIAERIEAIALRVKEAEEKGGRLLKDWSTVKSYRCTKVG